MQVVTYAYPLVQHKKAIAIIHGLFVLAISVFFYWLEYLIAQFRWISFPGSLKTDDKNRSIVIDELIQFIFIL